MCSTSKEPSMGGWPGAYSAGGAIIAFCARGRSALCRGSRAVERTGRNLAVLACAMKAGGFAGEVWSQHSDRVRYSAAGDKRRARDRSRPDRRRLAAVGLGNSPASTLTRERHADDFLDAIIEGPYDWVARPVSEFFSMNAIFACFGPVPHWSGRSGEYKTTSRSISDCAERSSTTSRWVKSVPV